MVSYAKAHTMNVIVNFLVELMIIFSKEVDYASESLFGLRVQQDALNNL